MSISHNHPQQKMDTSAGIVESFTQPINTSTILGGGEILLRLNIIFANHLLDSRSHVNSDLLPYVCLSDQCLGPKIFPSSGEWARHMVSQHGNDWALNIHELPAWRYDHVSSSNKQSLHLRTLEHLGNHDRTDHNFITSTHTISDQTAEDDISNNLPIVCPLCHMTLPRHSSTRLQAITTEVSNDSDSLSKVKSGPAKSSAKVRFAGDFEDVIYEDTEEESAQHQTSPDDKHLNFSRALSSHIAEHLQRLALLTLRLNVGAADIDGENEFDSDNPAADDSISAYTTSTIALLLNQTEESIEDEVSSKSGIEKVLSNCIFELGNSSHRNLTNVQDPELPLATRLKNSTIQCAYDSSQSFLPNDAIEDIITPENVEAYIFASDHDVLRDHHFDVVNFVCGNPKSQACRIFAVLLLIDYPQLIMDFMEENISDLNLPLCLRDSENSHFAEYCLDKKVGNSLIAIERFNEWRSEQRYAFYKHQWWVNSPVFGRNTSKLLDDQTVIHLHNSTILPWIEYEPIHARDTDVVRVRIHHAHHTFGSEVSNTLTEE